jgi:hypothetical protein
MYAGVRFFVANAPQNDEGKAQNDEGKAQNDRKRGLRIAGKTTK